PFPTLCRSCSSVSMLAGAPLRKYAPLLSKPSVISVSSSAWASTVVPLGITAVKPAEINGVTTMKMISSTSMTSIIGVTLISAVTPPLLPVDMATAAHRLLGLELLGEDRAAELAPHGLDQVVDQFLGGVDRKSTR